MAPIVRGEILREFTPDCCVATCNILRTVFAHYHFDATPLAVKVIINNAQFVKAREAGERIPSGEDKDELHRWMDKRGAWSLGIVPESGDGKTRFGGHLILRLQGVLVDASIDQCNRPEKGIVLLPFLVMPARPDFLNGTASLAGKSHDVELIYTVLKGDHSWRSAPDWTDKVRCRGAVNRILERLEWSRT